MCIFFVSYLLQRRSQWRWMTPESAGALLIGCSPSRRHSPSPNSRWADCYAENNTDKHHYPHFFSPTPPHLNMWFIKSMTCHCWGNSLREGTTVSRRLSSPWGPWRVARQSWGRHTEEQDCLSLWSLCRKQRESILIIHDATGCFSHTRNAVKRRRGVDPSRCKLTLWEGCCPVLHHGDRILILKFLSNTNERERPVTEYKQATSGQAPVEWIGSDEGRHNNRSFTFDTKLVLRKRFLDTKYDFFY